MSLKVGSRTRTHIPIVSNPKENVIAVSDKNNDTVEVRGHLVHPLCRPPLRGRGLGTVTTLKTGTAQQFLVLIEQI